MSLACRQAVQAAREANPRLTVDAALEILRRQRITPLPSASTIKREFARVKERRKYARRKAKTQGRTAIVELPLAGGELLAAAENETGGIAALTSEVVRIAKDALEASEGQTPEKDVAGRNADGQFTTRYNRARRRKRGQQVASYLRTAEEKAEGRVPSWPRFVHEQADTIDAKLRMLVFCQPVAGLIQSRSSTHASRGVYAAAIANSRMLAARTRPSSASEHTATSSASPSRK